MQIIRKVWGNQRGQLLITIPTNSNIRKGDYVKVEKVGEGGEVGT